MRQGVGATVSEGWTVTVEATGEAGDVTDAGLEALARVLEAYDGAVNGGPGYYGATFSLYGVGFENLPECAAARGVEIFRFAAICANLPDWGTAEVRVQSFAAHDAELARPAIPQLVGVSEIADILAVSPERAHELMKRDDFPGPVAEIAAGPIWTRDSIERFVDNPPPP